MLWWALCVSHMMCFSSLFLWIYLQAAEKPDCTVAYANLCKVLSPIKVEWTEHGKIKTTTFRTVLLTKCQHEFERGDKANEQEETMLAAIEKAETVRGERMEGDVGRCRGGRERGGRKKERDTV